jgi:hypothetical protein
MTKKLCVCFAALFCRVLVSPKNGETRTNKGEVEGAWILTSLTSRLRLAGFQQSGISANGVARPQPHRSRTQSSVIRPAKTLICSEYG